MNNVTKMELYKVLSKPQVYIIFVVGLIIQSIMAGRLDDLGLVHADEGAEDGQVLGGRRYTAEP